MSKEFDLHKGGRGNPQKFGSGHEYDEPKSPAITVRERMSKTRDPLEYETPVIKDFNYSRHLHKPAEEPITLRNPAEIADNSWRPFSEGKGGISNIADEGKGREYEPPPDANYDFLKNFKGKKP